LQPQHTDLAADPFDEARGPTVSMTRQLLGGRFHFESNDRALLRLAEAAYDGLPEHRFPDISPEFHVELRLLPAGPRHAAAEPPSMRMQSGAGIVCGVVDVANYVVLSPERHHALVVVSADRIAHAYHVRHEFIEFAVFVLATRGLGLVPLHAGCVGRGGRGALLFGASGAGKSTLALHAFLGGMDLLAEDAVFVHPASLLATSVPNFLHLKAESLAFVDDDAAQRWIAESPMIRRRGGAEKFEPDARRLPGGHVARTPLHVTAAVFLSDHDATDGAALLRALPREALGARLAAEQPYACRQPGWQAFATAIAGLGAHELRRGRHPRDSVDAIRRLLA
jgi:hypothetical protein